ncbi:hypothetical protein VFPFJ_05100 [Purpureocillium lilacinum]|uniref:Uncharacterized protein n=1 Tax=Purpureocillium lilacinum TaxID=33203 RepID=A0A179HN22_PURLI|nr:hypothetical protein VFPFJ_05100 [Purpureocillium lilacinum]OAQ90941.1 hypothetical protein VFPFJ_05100 [Purpureocillium lilacinum]
MSAGVCIQSPPCASGRTRRLTRLDKCRLQTGRCILSEAAACPRSCMPRVAVGSRGPRCSWLGSPLAFQTWELLVFRLYCCRGSRTAAWGAINGMIPSLALIYQRLKITRCTAVSLSIHNIHRSLGQNHLLLNGTQDEPCKASQAKVLRPWRCHQSSLPSFLDAPYLSGLPH